MLLGRSRKITLKSYPIKLEAEELAIKARQDLGLKGPVRDVHKLLRKQGIMIWELEVLEDVFPGFSCWHKEYGPIIMVNANEFFHAVGSHRS